MPVAPSHVEAVIKEFLARSPPPAEVQAIAAQCPSADVLIEVVLQSDEYKQRYGMSAANAAAHWVNIWHPELAQWTLAPGTQSADGDVVVGQDGFLFLAGGTNRFVDQYQGKVILRPGWLESWRRVFEARRSDPVHAQRTCVSIVIPDPLVILHHLYPRPLSSGMRPVESLLEDETTLLYPVEALAADYETFCRRADSHYTSAASHALYDQVRVQIPDAPPLPDPELVPVLAAGDLGSRFSPAILESLRVAGSLGAAEVVEDNWREMMSVGAHRGTRRVFRNRSAPDSRRVVIFGDSYAHIEAVGGFRGVHEGLSWPFAQVFAEVHFLWSAFGWDPDYVVRVNADVVVHQIAERFLPRVPEVQTPVAALRGVG
jgi:hypothetical protein